MKKSRKYSLKRIFRKKEFMLSKTKSRNWNLAARLEHKRVEGKRKK